MTEKKALNFHIPILVTLLALNPIIFVPNVWPAVRWLIFLFLSIFAAVILIKDKLYIYDRSFIPLGLFTIFVLISAIFSQYYMEAWIGASYYFTGFLSYLFFAVLFIFAFCVALRFPGEITKILNIWLLSVSIIAIIGLLQYFGIDLVPLGNETRSYSTIGNSNDLGSFLVMAFPFVAIRFLQKPGYYTVVILSLVYGAILTTLCRGAWLGLAVGIVLLLFYYPTKHKIFQMLVIMLMVTAFLMPVNNWRLIDRVGTVTKETEMVVSGDTEAGAARLLLWKESLKALPNSPLVGIGPDAILYASQDKFEERFGRGIPIKAHNIYLEIAVTMGIPALIAYLWFLFTILWKTDRKNPVHFAFLMMVVIYLVRGFFLVDVISVYPLFWVLLGFYQGSKVIET